MKLKLLCYVKNTSENFLLNISKMKLDRMETLFSVKQLDGSPPGSSVPGILQARILEWVAISFSNACIHAKSPQSCPTLCDPMDSSPPGSSVHGILQARVLYWVAISFSRGRHAFYAFFKEPARWFCIFFK